MRDTSICLSYLSGWAGSGLPMTGQGKLGQRAQERGEVGGGAGGPQAAGRSKTTVRLHLAIQLPRLEEKGWQHLA